MSPSRGRAAVDELPLEFKKLTGTVYGSVVSVWFRIRPGKEGALLLGEVWRSGPGRWNAKFEGESATAVLDRPGRDTAARSLAAKAIGSGRWPELTPWAVWGETPVGGGKGSPGPCLRFAKGTDTRRRCHRRVRACVRRRTIVGVPRLRAVAQCLDLEGKELIGERGNLLLHPGGAIHPDEAFFLYRAAEEARGARYEPPPRLLPWAGPDDPERGRGAKTSCPALREWSETVRQELGLDDFYVYDLDNGDLVLSFMVVPAHLRKQGLGTTAMKRLVELADQNARRIWLTPSAKDPRLGTTSRARLVRFYRRFGFVENKGRHRDSRLSYSMYRDPAGSRSGRASFVETTRAAKALRGTGVRVRHGEASTLQLTWGGAHAETTWGLHGWSLDALWGAPGNPGAGEQLLRAMLLAADRLKVVVSTVPMLLVPSEDEEEALDRLCALYSRFGFVGESCDGATRWYRPAHTSRWLGKSRSWR